MEYMALICPFYESLKKMKSTLFLRYVIYNDVTKEYLF